jgi:hypothetical protein
MEPIGFLGGLGFLLVAAVAIFVLISAVLGFLLPFFVLSIRREVSEINTKVGKLIELVGASTERGR